MKPLGPTIAAAFAVALVLGACSGDEPPAAPASKAPKAVTTVSPAPSATPSPTPSTLVSGNCPNEAAVASNSLDRVSGPLIGDVDGDATPERIYLAVDDTGSPGCQAFVVVSGTAISSAPVADWDPAAGLPAPSLNRLVQIDGRPGAEVVVNLAAGASTQFVGVFSVAGGSFERLTTDRRADPSIPADEFAFGGSVGHLDAVDCTTDGDVVVSSAVPKGARYQVERRFYSPRGAALDLDDAKTQRPEVAASAIDRFPEFASSPFGSCPPA